MKSAIITGGNAGIGLETAKELAKLSYKVGIVVRNKEKAEKALAEIINFSGNKDVNSFICDLSSQQQIRRAGEEIKRKYDVIDVLINNAGALYPTHELTEDNIERQFAINHLAYFLLTNLLLGRISKSEEGRIVNVASSAHYSGVFNWSDLNHKHKYKALKVYAQSKLANVMFTYELAERLKDFSTITLNALHPGFVDTSIGNKHTTKFQGFLWNLLKKVKSGGAISVKDGAETSIYLASSKDVKGVSGRYWDECKPKEPNPLVHNVEQRQKLWKKSLELTGIKDYFAKTKEEKQSI